MARHQRLAPQRALIPEEKPWKSRSEFSRCPASSSWRPTLRRTKSRRQLASALTSDDDSVFAVTMSKGGKILVPADKIAYVEFGAPEARRVGFGNIVLPGTAGLPSGPDRLLVH